MPEHTPQLAEPEAVAVFDTVEALEAAIDDLRMAGFSRADISLLGDEETMSRKLGRSYRATRTLEDDPDAPREAYVSKEAIGAAEGALIGMPAYVASLATLGLMIPAGAGIAAAITVAALAGGAGAAIGGLLARRVGKDHADRLEQQIAHGGLLLWVRTIDTAHEEKATAILTRHGGRDVHVHPWTTPD
jgi:hypothetical protein